MGENCTVKSCMISTLHHVYFQGGQVKEDDMNGAYGMCGEEENCVQGFGGETWGNEHMENTGLGGNDNIKLHLKEMEWHFMDWLCLAWDRGN